MLKNPESAVRARGRALLLRTAALLFGAGLAAVSCTNDFSTFHERSQAGGQAGSATGGASAGGGGSGTGGAAGGAGAGGLRDGGPGGQPEASTGGAGTGGTDSGAGGTATGGTGTGGAGTGGAGTGGVGTGGTAAGGADSGAGCLSTQKQCPVTGSCTALSNPATGCSAAGTCSACTLQHTATYACDGTGACAVATCSSGFDTCDGNANNGCEQDIGGDALHCGACTRACAGANVTSLACAAGLCTSYCAPGFGNCTRPATGTDDGCETNVQATAATCGSCSNTCPSGFICGSSLCACDGNNDCGGGNQCTAGLCVCGGTPCARGETCGGGACRCNGGAACTVAGQTCCQNSPNGGCVDLQTSPQNCGACGRACATGFACVGGQCQCAAAADCNAGTAGTCSGGVCTCGTTVCTYGQRCLSDGTCG